MVPYVEKAKQRGPSITSEGPLKAWLDGVGNGVIRVPLTVVSGGFPGEPWVLKIGALSVKMNDSALGVSFEDRVRQVSKGSRPVRVWVEGRWDAANTTVKIIHFSRAIADDEAADYVERESD
ncbi:MAG: hypothetical protein QM817_30565 [Archangium sp.]